MTQPDNFTVKEEGMAPEAQCPKCYSSEVDMDEDYEECEDDESGRWHYVPIWKFLCNNCGERWAE